MMNYLLILEETTYIKYYHYTLRQNKILEIQINLEADTQRTIYVTLFYNKEVKVSQNFIFYISKMSPHHMSKLQGLKFEK